jgi:hypothetical protein
MVDVFNTVELSQADADKIKRHLEKIQESQAKNADLEAVLSSASQEFNQFFSQYGKPYFAANELRTNDTARSSIYNENLVTLSDDISRLYQLLSSSAKSTVSAFNYASVITKEITNQADASSSRVLDLNILNGFNRGQVIVAGDDFTDSSKIDSTIGVDTTAAEINHGANILTLKVVGSVTVTGPNVKVSITPVKPIGADGKVNTDPTPLNLERFYEGKYYAYIGQQEPEGGNLKLKYIVNPADIPAQTSVTTANDKLVQGSVEALQDAYKSSNFYAVVPSTEEEKQAIRARMFDGNPDTYWQCEFVYQTDPLIDPQDKQAVDLENSSGQ